MWKMSIIYGVLVVAIGFADWSLASSQTTDTANLQIRSFAARAWQQASPDIETPHWAELSAQATIAPPEYGVHGTSKLSPAYFGHQVAMPLEFGGQTFQVQIDTGSSDTWVASQHFECFQGEPEPEKAPQASCGFAALYHQTASFQPIPDHNLNVSYGNGEFVTGIPGLDTVTVANITIPSTHINIANKANWYGDNSTSGLIGLAYPALTHLYNGTNPSKDHLGDEMTYPTIFTSMFTNASVPPVFSLALERKPGSHGLLAGGKIAFGGLPPVRYSPGFASTQIIIYDVLGGYPAAKHHYSEYTIIPDGFVFPGAGNFSMVEANTTGTFGQADAQNIAHTNVRMVVDSGTPYLYLPAKIADAVNAAFSPPAVLSATYGLYITSCNAVPPRFGIVIGGKKFYLNPQDIFWGPSYNGTCVSAILPGGTLDILGTPLLKSVLAVFDVGAGEMRFASREQY